LTVRHRAAEELMKPGGIDLQAKLQVLAWILLGVVALRLVLVRRAELRLLLHPPLCWFNLFAASAVLSTMYSVSPPLTLFRSGQIVIVILLAISLQDEFRRIYFLIAMYLVANWVLVLMATTGIDLGLDWVRGPRNEFVLFGSESGVHWRFGSPLGHPSQISVVGAAGAAGLLARSRGPRLGGNLPLLCFFVVTVLLTISRTAIAGMFAGIVVVLVVRRLAVPLILLVGIAAPLTMMLPALRETVVAYGMRGQSTDEFKNLTGRAEIYQQGVDRAVAGLPFGEGFVAGRAKMIVSKDIGESIVHSHNLFIESTVGMGLIGMLAAATVMLVWLLSLLRAIKLPADESGISPGWEMVAMSIPLLGFCILDRGFAGPAAPFQCLFIVVLTRTTKLLLDGPKECTAAEGLTSSST
jgi:O-antigen ligase